MNLWQILILAVLQGITEFLPVSSSGHLVIAAALLSPTGKTADLDVLEVSIVLHFGTLLSILVFYRDRIWRLLGEDRRVIGLLIVTTIPAAIFGVLLKKMYPDILENPLLAGCMLPITGLILLWAGTRPQADGDYRKMGPSRAWWIGIAQAIAILPGISRSGTTISAGLGLKLSRQSAATYSFLAALPAIGGASALEGIDLLKGHTIATPWPFLLAGMLVSFVVGLGALWWLIHWLQTGRLTWFAWWCIAVGSGVIVWQTMFV